jgi:hypothetical protein
VVGGGEGVAPTSVLAQELAVLVLVRIPKNQRVSIDLQRSRAFLWSYDSAPLPSPDNKLSLFLSLPVRRRSSLLTGEWGGGGGVELNHTTARKPGPGTIFG